MPIRSEKKECLLTFLVVVEQVVKFISKLRFTLKFQLIGKSFLYFHTINLPLVLCLLGGGH